MCLQKWVDEGATLQTLRFIAYYFLAIIDYLKLDKKRMIHPEEIQQAAEQWAARKGGNAYGKRDFSHASMVRFESVAINWLHTLGWLHDPQEKADLFLEGIIKYIDYMREEKFSEEIIYSCTCVLKDFFKYIAPISSLRQINTLIIEDVINKKYLEGQNEPFVQAYASALRIFLNYAEEQKWCLPGLTQSIKTSQVYQHEKLPHLSCDDIEKLLETTEGNQPTNIRDRAIIMLLAVYGLRCKEISQLRFEDIEWENEMLCIRRSTAIHSQKLPLSQAVKSAVLLYLLKVRPSNCLYKEIFVTRRVPYHPLTSSAIFHIVSKRLKLLKLNLKHHGPHTLRHACAVRLNKEGIPLTEISNHLGYLNVESSRSKITIANSS